MLTFKEIRGQDVLSGNLRQGVANGQVHHANLFYGPKGVGKRTTALAFAAALNCLAPEEGDACGQCSSCLRIKSGNHPDFYQVVTQGKSIKIEQIRELQEALSYKHWQGPYKVALLEEADLLTEEAANSLLKILEEPPRKTVFVLTTSRPQSLLPTILSRCQQISFRPLMANQLKDLLLDKGVGEEQASLLANLSNGSPGRALMILEDETFLQKREDALRYCNQLAKGGIKESFEVAESLSKEDDWETSLELMGLWWRDLLLWELSKTKKLLVNLDLYNEILQESMEKIGLKSALLELEKVRRNLRLNANRKLCLEVMALKINQAFAGSRKGGSGW